MVKPCYSQRFLTILIPSETTTNEPLLDDHLDHDNETTIILGDMQLTPTQYQVLFSNNTLKRHGFERSFQHWPEATVDFLIDQWLPNSLKSAIAEAMFHISSVSCIKFKAADQNSKNFIYITRGNGCSSAVGNLRRGRQFVNLSTECQKGNIIHELLHTLGFLHMHTAPQRDDYVKIIKENIHPNVFQNFDKYTHYVSMFNTDYDYSSIMHYRQEAFAIDPTKATIVPLRPAKNMGQRMSE